MDSENLAWNVLNTSGLFCETGISRNVNVFSNGLVVEIRLLNCF